MKEILKKETDITIIGAGMAGLLSSLWLIKMNIPHIIVESKNFPREKACGDIITSNAIRRLNEIDPAIIEEMFSLGIIMPITGTNIYAPNHKTISLEFKYLDDVKGVYSTFSVKRHLLDEFLMARIKKSALAEVIMPFSVQKIVRENNLHILQTKKGDQIYSKLVILASGSNSILNEQLVAQKRKDKHVAVGIRGYFKGVHCRRDYGEFLFDRRLMPGGVYITPLPEDNFNVNIVMRKDVLKKKNINLKKTFLELIEENPKFHEKFKDAVQVGEFKGSSLNLGTQKRRISGDGFMMTGDSAGLIDLISANGIPQAMLSGKLAAKKAVDCLKQKDFSAKFMHSYDVELYRRIKSDLSLGKVFNPFLSSSFVNNTALKVFNMIATEEEGRSPLTDLFYQKNPALHLLNPSFYKKLGKHARSKHNIAHTELNQQ